MANTLLSFYKSEAWEEFRKRIIAERTGEDGILRDEVTGEPILRKYDCILHHVEELTEDNWRDVTISLNPDNIKVVSFRTHNALHKRGFLNGGNANGLKKVYLVWGSPCAGKSTWVSEMATEDDLVVDIDRIWAALRAGGCGENDKPWRIKDVVFDLYGALLDSVKVRRGRWNYCYIITAKCVPSELSRLCERLGVDKCIHIDTDKATCLERLRNSHDRDIEKWTEYIERYFELYELHCI